MAGECNIGEACGDWLGKEVVERSSSRSACSGQDYKMMLTVVDHRLPKRYLPKLLWVPT
jgi:hypothetical protein